MIKMRHNASAKVVGMIVGVVAVGSLATAFGCRPRRSGSGLAGADSDHLDLANSGRAQYQGAAGGLDAADATFVFPLPTSDEELQGMLGLGTDISPPPALKNLPREKVQDTLADLAAGKIDDVARSGLDPLAFAMRVSKYGQSLVSTDEAFDKGDYVNATQMRNPIFLTKDAFEQAMKNGEEMGATFADGARDYDNWKIVSMRFKPCEGKLGVDDAFLTRNKDAITKLGTVPDADFVSLNIEKDHQRVFGAPEVKGARGVFQFATLRACSFQINLIAQPIVKRGGKFVALDQALHLLHHYPFALRGSSDDREPLLFNNYIGYTTEMAVKLRQIKAALKNDGIDTNAQPLGVHPVFKAGDAGLARKYRSVMQEFIKQYFGMGKLNLIAFAGNKEDHTWIFFTQGMTSRIGDAKQDSSIITVTDRLSGGVHPNRSDKREERVQRFSLFDGDLSVITPPILDTARPQLSSVPGVRNAARAPADRTVEDVWNVPGTTGALVNLQLARVGPVDETMGRPGDFSQRGRAIRQAFIINNPSQSSITEMDCMSCHNVTPRIREEYVSGEQLADAKLGLPFDPDSPVTAEMYVAPTNLSSFIDQSCAARSLAEVRNLGYFFGKCSLGIRVVNETASQAAFVNMLMGWSNPAPAAECNGSKKALILCSELRPYAECRKELCGG
jgi:hypothetical protein